MMVRSSLIQFLCVNCTAVSTVVRLTAAVYEALAPILNEMKEDISSVKREIKTNVDSSNNDVTELVAFLGERIIGNLTEVVEKRLSSLNESVKMELSRVNGIISDLSRDLQIHSQQTTSQLDTRLSSLNESMRDNFNSVISGLIRLNQIVFMTYDYVDEHDYHITNELKKMNQSLAEKIMNNARYSCGGTTNWRRAVHLNMTDPNTNYCPSGWQLTGYSKKTCGRVGPEGLTCDSVFFPVGGGPYSQVCGRIRAYQYGLPDGFSGFSDRGQTTIDSVYVSGVSVLHGSPRQHIWTFAVGPWENNTVGHQSERCPCDGGVSSIPPFVGEDYFCESGYVWPGYRNDTDQIRIHSNDPLWDGEGCHSTSTCCSFHDPPYFTKTLNQTTNDDLELRICLRDLLVDNVAVELVDLYVK